MKCALLFGILLVAILGSEARIIHSQLPKGFPINRDSTREQLKRKLNEVMSGAKFSLKGHLPSSRQAQTSVGGYQMPIPTANAILLGGHCFLEESFWKAILTLYGDLDVFDVDYGFDGLHRGIDPLLDLCKDTIGAVMVYIADPTSRDEMDAMFKEYNHNASCGWLDEETAKRINETVIALEQAITEGDELTVYALLDVLSFYSDMHDFIRSRCYPNQRSTAQTAVKKGLNGELSRLLSSKQAVKQSAWPTNKRDIPEGGLLDTAILEAMLFVADCAFNYQWDEEELCGYAYDALVTLNTGSEEERREALAEMRYHVQKYKCDMMGKLGEEFNDAESDNDKQLVQQAMNHYSEFLDAVGEFVEEKLCDDDGSSSSDTDDYDDYYYYYNDAGNSQTQQTRKLQKLLQALLPKNK